jgi:hypothetical protein
MIKRILLGLTFLAAFGTLSVATPSPAEAWGRWRRPYVAYYSAPRVYYSAPRVYDDYYSGYVPYRAYYGPRFYRPYRSVYYGYPGPYYRSYYRPGVSVSVGF